MVLIKRLDLSLKTPKEKLVALFQTAEIDEAKDTVVQEHLSFLPEDWDEETSNAIKRLLGLPIKKDLVYYRKQDGEWRQYPVIKWEIVQEYSDSCSLRIRVKELGDIHILHAFLSEMQKPSFERDMEEQFRTGLTE